MNPYSSQGSNSMAAMLTTSANPSHSHNQMDIAWYMDFGATHHFTPEFGQQQDPSTYKGDAQVMIDNGKHIGISHIGHVMISTPVKPV